MSQVCIKWEKGVDHDPEVSLKNYEGSLKGMEAAGSSRLTIKRFDTGEVVIGEHVGDDDSSYRMVMRHSYQDLINAGKMRSDEWPRFKGNKKKPDDGLLPVPHPIIVFRADKGHRVRNYAKFFFFLAGKIKAERLVAPASMLNETMISSCKKIRSENSTTPTTPTMWRPSTN
jgi:hypothetical protein